MGAMMNALKSLKLWQIGVMAAILVGVAGATYGVYTLVSGSGNTGVGADQQLIPVQYGNLVNQVSTNGSLVFSNTATLTFGTQGTVAEILVAEGQQVKEGQLVARLDAATVTSLQKTVAQARVNLQTAQNALAIVKAPRTSLALAQAEAKVATAKLSLKTAQDALDTVKAGPTAGELAQAEAKVATAKLSLKTAQDALDTVKAGPTASDLAKAQARVDSAKASLSNDEQNLKVVQKTRDANVKTAVDLLATAKEGYQTVFAKWLGVQISQDQIDLAPDANLASWKVDLNALFDPSMRFLDIGKGWFAEGTIPSDDPATPWDESTIFTWLNFYPGTLLATCQSGVVPQQGTCVKKEMDDAWTAYQNAKDNMDAVQTQASTAIVNAQNAITLDNDAITTAETALADLKAGSDPLQVDAKVKQLAVSQAALEQAEADLADLKAGPDPLQVDASVKQLAVSQAALEQAEVDLANLKASTPLDVANKAADVAAAQVALDTATQRLEGATLKASIAGVVSLVNVVVGQTVSATTTIMNVVDSKTVELDGTVGQTDVLSVKVGSQANVTMDALPGQVLQGTVSSIGSAAQTSSGVVTYPISITLTVPQGLELREGLSATASIVIRQENNVLLVPLQALYGTFDQPVVKVMSNGSIQDKPVVLGNSDDYWVAVRQGLAQGDQVVMQSATTTAGQLNVGQALRQFQGQFGGAVPGGGFIQGGGNTPRVQATPRTN